MSPPSALQFARDPMSEDPALWDDLRKELSLSSISTETDLQQSSFPLTDHPANGGLRHSEYLARSSLLQIEQLLSITGPRAWYSENLWKRCEDMRRTLGQNLLQMLQWKEEIWRAQRRIREEGHSLPALDDRNFAHHINTCKYTSLVAHTFGWVANFSRKCDICRPRSPVGTATR